MSFFFKQNSEKSAQLVLDELTLTLDKQRTENNKLKTQLEDLKEADLKNKLLLEEFQKSSEQADNNIQQLRETLNELEHELATTEVKIQDLTEEKLRLSSTVQAETDFATANMQELLDLAERENEVLGFKDSHGKLWVLRKRKDITVKDDDDEVHLAMPNPQSMVSNL